MPQCGIYKISSSLHPDKCYVGSARNLKNRWNTHKSNLLHHKHHSKKMQNYVNKYGMDNLAFLVLEECPSECTNQYLIEREQYYLDSIRPWFNSRIIADRNDGVPCSEETKQKLRVINTGKKLSAEAKQKISAVHKGKRLTEAQKERMSISRTGRIVSAETRRKLSEFNTGKKASPETINKLVESHKGLKLTEETRRKLSESRMGHDVSDETKHKISEANAGKEMTPEHYAKCAPTMFKKGMSPWCTGMKMTPEYKQKLSIAHIGIPSPRKGTKRILNPLTNLYEYIKLNN